MHTYATIIDLIQMEGPGLQDYVTPTELDELLSGTLNHGYIADRYLDDLKHSTKARVATDQATTRTDLLTWIRWELEIAVEQRDEDAKEEAQQNKLDAMRKVVDVEERFVGRLHHRKAELIAEAREMGIQKAAIAEALKVSRPTLDKWLQEQQDRALFNDAIYTLVRRDTSKADQEMLFRALGIRDTSAQASVFLAGLSTRTLDDLREGEQELISRAEKRARELA
ncbi:hypothetical protein [Streptomyces stelliscabiei]|uniref:hypothetical protein n=1 Tax=Streptomyces stelliscabiei TaxID=146820 RepID=UPI002FF05A4B